MKEHLNPHHRKTIEHIFSHPTSSNIEWRSVISLLESIGAAGKHAHGRIEVKLGNEIEFLEEPHGKDIDKQMIVDLRRMLKNAGYGPDADADAAK